MTMEERIYYTQQKIIVNAKRKSDLFKWKGNSVVIEVVSMLDSYDLFLHNILIVKKNENVPHVHQ